MNISLVSDLRNKFSEVRDQRTRPTCLAFATSDAHGATFTAFRTMSVEYLYYHAVQFMPSKDPGGGISPEAARKSLALHGQPEEAHWPYQNALPADISKWLPPVSCPVFKRNVSGDSTAFDDISSVLNAQKPVILCLELSRSFFTPLPTGIVLQKAPDLFAGNHAVIALGHGHTTRERCLLIRNSWGSGWGLDGHAFLEEGYLANRILATAVLE